MPSTALMKLEDFEGSWYINMTNFPMWLKGDRLYPTLNYQVREKNGVLGLKDTVKFHKNGKPDEIGGFDKPLDKEASKFSWRGNGLLWLLESKWQILYYDADRQIAISHFDKTIFTPEGMDVISKKKKLSLEEIEWVLQTVKENKFPAHPPLQEIAQI